jgi:hypothetical protein
MELLPIWRTPIEFEAAGGFGQTWGLVTFELYSPGSIPEEREFGRLHDLGTKLVGASLALAERDRKDLRDSTNDAETLAWLTEAARAEAETLEPLRRFRDEVIGPVIEAGVRSGKVTGDPSAAADVIRDYGPPLLLEQYVSGAWGVRCSNLVQRAAVELFDLFQHRPRLGLCHICKRNFVLHGDETNCRWHIWGWLAKAGDRPLLYCDQTPQRHDQKSPKFEEAETADHRKEWSRLNMRVRRAGERHARAVKEHGPRSKRARELAHALRDEEAAFAAFPRRPRGHRITLRGDDAQRTETPADA